MDYSLVILLLIPAAGALLCALMTERAAKTVALATSLAALAMGLVIAFGFIHAPEAAGHPGIKFYFGPDASGAANDIGANAAGFAVRFGIDAVSLWLILLTVFLTPLALASSFASIKQRQKEYYGWMLALLCVMLGVFIARDLLLFYIFFELTLVPMFFIIGIWGGPQRRQAAAKFFLFTFAGSIFALAAVIYLGVQAHTFDLAAATEFAQTLGSRERFWVVLGLVAGFAVKVPLFPVHTWLPLAHTEAPTAGSVILAGVLLKLGTYGLLRLAVPVGLAGAPFPGLIHVLGTLCVIGIIYGALIAWVQQDIKKLVAYSSVSHLGFCVLGLLALNQIGMQGSVLYMVNHGLSTGAMFLVIGMIYDRHHTRDINQLSGLAKQMPKMAFFFVLFVFSSIGLPPLNGFVSEFTTVQGAFSSPHLGVAYASFAALGVILGAVYMLHMTARVIWGPLKTPASAHGHGGHAAHEENGLPTDLNAREMAILIPLALAVIGLGVWSAPVTSSMSAPLARLAGVVEERIEPMAPLNAAAQQDGAVAGAGEKSTPALTPTEGVRLAAGSAGTAESADAAGLTGAGQGDGGPLR